MKGSAITGPVAKECVRLVLLAPLNKLNTFNCRQICGRVSRRMRVPSYELIIFLRVLHAMNMSLDLALIKLCERRRNLIFHCLSFDMIVVEQKPSMVLLDLYVY
jgi:hypothetical protein